MPRYNTVYYIAIEAKVGVEAKATAKEAENCTGDAREAALCRTWFCPVRISTYMMVLVVGLG